MASTRQRLYAYFLTTPQWRDARQRALDRAGHVCERCGDSYDICVHHTTYQHGWLCPRQHEWWVYRVLCGRCHRYQHGLCSIDPAWSMEELDRWLLRRVMRKSGDF